jgi:sugar phosphate isomerase/epimerase
LTAADDSDGWGGFPIGVQTFSLRKYPLPEAIRHLQGMGVRYVEFSAGTHLPATASDEQIAEARRLAAKARLTISAHGVNRFSKDHATNRRIFESAKKLGIRTITANPQRDAETFASLDKLVAEYDMRIAIHNHGPDALYDKLDDVVRAIQGHDHRIGACVDCGHYLSSGEDPVKCVLTLGDRVFGVHLKDHAEIGKKSPNVVIGKGHLDVVALFRALRRIEFPADGALSLEYEANPENPIDDMKACLDLAKQAIAKSA